MLLRHTTIWLLHSRSLIDVMMQSDITRQQACYRLGLLTLCACQEVLVINSLETDAHFLLANAYDAQGKGKRAAQHRAALAAAQSK